ncbi:MAG: PEP-CTERM sorting domain-containing protein [Terracidiphilus sp.]|jgi:hypothetical protein
MNRFPDLPKSAKTCKFEKKFAAYTLAGAALVAPAAARADAITYVPNVDTTVSQPGTYTFNLSGPSAEDIVLAAAAGTDFFGNASNNITFSTNNGAMVLMDGPSNVDASALALGTLIDPSSINWAGSGKLGDYDTVNTGTFGDWSPGTDAYLGFYFEGTNGPQAGWAEITTDGSDASFEVLSYAYETQANTPIDAGQIAATPEPSTMALVVLGASGLMALRRRRAATL